MQRIKFILLALFLSSQAIGQNFYEWVVQIDENTEKTYFFLTQEGYNSLLANVPADLGGLTQELLQLKSNNNSIGERLEVIEQTDLPPLMVLVDSLIESNRLKDSLIAATNARIDSLNVATNIRIDSLLANWGNGGGGTNPPEGPATGKPMIRGVHLLTAGGQLYAYVYSNEPINESVQLQSNDTNGDFTFLVANQLPGSYYYRGYRASYSPKSIIEVNATFNATDMIKSAIEINNGITKRINSLQHSTTPDIVTAGTDFPLSYRTITGTSQSALLQENIAVEGITRITSGNAFQDIFIKIKE